MTDHKELIDLLRSSQSHTMIEAADAIEAQAKRIAELEVPLCIGQRTIGIMAEEGCWQSENGRAVVAADELFKQDPYERIAELEKFKKLVEFIANDYHELSHDKASWQRNDWKKRCKKLIEEYYEDTDRIRPSS